MFKVGDCARLTFAMPRSGSSARIRSLATRTSQRRDTLAVGVSAVNVLRYGIGGLGTGVTSQTADAQDGRGGVGIRASFPCVAAEPPFMQAPVNVSRLG